MRHTIDKKLKNFIDILYLILIFFYFDGTFGIVADMKQAKPLILLFINLLYRFQNSNYSCVH
jgi:hypothetical protein